MKYQLFEPGHFYHVYNRGNNKENIFRTEENYNFFLKLVKKYLLLVTDIYCYCLMPNHFHLIVKIKEEKFFPAKFKSGKSKLHQPFSNLFNAYAKAFNKKYKRTGSLFQEHLKRIKIENERYLKNLIVYINTNSSHHDIANYESYKHSSFKDLLSNNTTFLKRNEVIDLFGDIENFKHVQTLKKRDIDSIEELLHETKQVLKTCLV